MVIDMNAAQAHALERVLQVVAGTQALDFGWAANDEPSHGWIE